MISIGLISAFMIGFICGLRALTAPAVVAWAARLGWTDLTNTPLHFMRSAVAVAVFTLFAIGELIGDQLPSEPNRTDLSGLIPRILLGALCGACLVASQSQSIAVGCLSGAAGSVAGAFGGFHARRYFVINLKIRDFIIATLEDAIAIGAGILIVSRF